MNCAVTASDAARASRSCSAGGSPRRSDRRRAARAACSAWRCAADWRLATSSTIPLTAVLMNVAGPKTTLAGLSSAIWRQTRGRLPRPRLLSGTLPDRQPSRRSTRPRSSVSTVLDRSPRTSTTTASSPKLRLKRSVAWKVFESRSTSVSVAALGSRRSASAAPASASRAVAASTSSGRRVTAATMRANAFPLTQVRLGHATGSGWRPRVLTALAEQLPQRRLRVARRRLVRVRVPPNV